LERDLHLAKEIRQYYTIKVWYIENAERPETWRIEGMAYLDCRGRVEQCRLDALPISLLLAGCLSLELDGASRIDRHHSCPADEPILLFRDCGEEYCKALPFDRKDLHLRLPEVAELSFDLSHDYAGNCRENVADSQALPGCPVHDDRGRSCPVEPEVLQTSLAAPGRPHGMPVKLQKVTT
jgi:hypothetical protein